MRYFILYTLMLCCSVAAHGQSIYFRHYQVEDGLSNNTVYAAYQDTRGFMWFGTKEGLNRFDGRSFKTFSMKQDDKQDTREFVYSISEGIRGTLWVGTRKGLYEFDPRTERFTLLSSAHDGDILNIKSDHKGKIWFISYLQLYCYDERKDTTRYYNLHTGQSRLVEAICIGKDETVWACSLDGYLFRYNAATDSFHCVNRNDAKRPAEVYRIYCTPSGQILLGTLRGLTCYDPVNGTYRPLLGLPLQSKPVYVHDILSYSEDEYWVASESGIYRVDWKTGRSVLMQQEDANPYSLSDNAVYALCKDREGGIWCGTYFGGVNYYHRRHSYFKKYFRNSSPNSLSGNAVRELCADEKGNLWIGTEDAGLNKLDPATGKITRYASPGTVSSTNIHALLIDGNELWVGTFQQGLDVLDVGTGKRLRHYNADPAGNGLQSNFIISACRTKAGEIMFGTNYGVFSFRRNTDRFKKVRAFPENSYVFCLYEDHSGTIWAGTVAGGLHYYNPATGDKGQFLYNARDTNSLSSNSVCGIFEDSGQQLWISTEGGGLCKLSKDRRRFTRYNTASGLPGNMVYKVLEDKNKQLWISTSKGLVCYDPAGNRWKIYTQSHGLLTDQFNYSSGYCDPNGKLYFGSVKGLISFDPDLVVPDTAGPPVYITSFEVNNQKLPVDASTMRYAISFSDTVTLAYDQSSFAIGFAALTYIAPDMTQYAYKLDGLDKDWTYLPANREVYFTNLSPGDYKFRIRTAGIDYSWQHKETQLVIRITPPWWRTTAAYIVYAMMVLALIFGLVNAYHHRQKEKHQRRLALFEQEKEKEIYKAKIDFFTNVAHEIRTPLTLIKGPLEMIMDEVGEQPAIKKNLQSIERNTDRLVALTDQLLDFRKMENQSFSLSFVKANVPALVQENCQAFATVMQQRSLSYRMEWPEKNFYAFIDTEAFHKIMSNLIGNAVKYAAEKLIVRVLAPSEQQPAFRIEVSNDGALIPWALREKIFEPFFRVHGTEQPGSGIGLSLSRALAQLHNGMLELERRDETMNTFVLTLPVHQEI